MKNSYLKTTGEWRETESLMGSSHSGGNCAEKVSYFCCYNLAADKAVGTLCWWTTTIQVLSHGNRSQWRKRCESQKGRGSNHQVLSAHISAQALDHNCVVQILVTQLKRENLNWDWSCCPLSVICTVYPPEMGFPGDLVVKNLPAKKKKKESACQCRRPRFNPWVRKIPWRRKWLPTPVFLPGKSYR